MTDPKDAPKKTQTFDPDPVDPQAPTAEVGSEGGSPGNTVKTRPGGKQLRGSEATETAKK